jgi:hypothetical protein
VRIWLKVIAAHRRAPLLDHTADLPVSYCLTPAPVIRQGVMALE